MDRFLKCSANLKYAAPRKLKASIRLKKMTTKTMFVRRAQIR